MVLRILDDLGIMISLSGINIRHGGVVAIQSHAINRLCRNGEACFSDPPDLSSSAPIR